MTFDVAWSPDCIDGRCYDVVTLSKSVDFLAVMAYDEMSQIFGPECTAYANSPFNMTKLGTVLSINLFTLSCPGLQVALDLHISPPVTRTPRGTKVAGVRVNRSWCQISFIMLIIKV